MDWIQETENKEIQKIEERINWERSRITEEESQIRSNEDTIYRIGDQMQKWRMKEQSIRPSYRGDAIYRWVSQRNAEKRKAKLRDRQHQARNLADFYKKQNENLKENIRLRQGKINAYEHDKDRIREQRERFERVAYPDKNPSQRAGYQKDQFLQSLGRDPEGLRPARRAVLHPDALHGPFVDKAKSFDWDGVKNQELNKEIIDPYEGQQKEAVRDNTDDRVTWQDELKNKINKAKAESRSMDEFQNNLEREGVQVRLRGDKIISFLPLDRETAIRGLTLGESYSREVLEDTFARNRDKTDNRTVDGIPSTDKTPENREVKTITDWAKRTREERETREESDDRYTYSTGHPFQQMVEAGRRLRDDPTPDNEREYIRCQSLWQARADEVMREAQEGNRDDRREDRDYDSRPERGSDYN